MVMKLCLDSTERGPGCWKLNNTVLENNDYTILINEVIDATMLQLADCDPLDKWELLKSQIIVTSQNFSKEHAMKGRAEIKNLQSKLHKLLLEMHQDHPESVINELKHAQHQLNLVMQKTTVGAIFRSRDKWYGEGERNSKYFFSLEKYNYNNKTMSKLMLKDGNITRNERKIIQEQRKFYHHLYTSNPDIKFT